MQIYNNQPRPRVLIEEIDPATAVMLERLVPTSRRIAFTDDVHEDEYDAVFTTCSSTRRRSHMCVVAYGADFLGNIEIPVNLSGKVKFGASVQRVKSGTLASELVVPSDVSDELGELVRTHLIPLFSDIENKPVLKVVGSSISSDTLLAQGQAMRAWCRPFLLTGDGHVLAASFVRQDGIGICWALPKGCPAPELWAALALKQFRTHNPDRFPALPSWWEQKEWATPLQHNARMSVAGLIRERDRALREFESQLIETRAKVREADELASTGPARLLTADGDQLVDAVAQIFRSIGFEVTDMDQVFESGRRREDLRLNDPDDPKWEAIVEVKGYRRGAAVNDLAKISRWGMLYASDHGGRLPSAMWHVVNAFRTTDPSARPVAIPNDQDLIDFTEDGGLLIDTRQLFRLHCSMEQGAIAAGDAKKALRAARGRFSDIART